MVEGGGLAGLAKEESIVTLLCSCRVRESIRVVWEKALLCGWGAVSHGGDTSASWKPRVTGCCGALTSTVRVVWDRALYINTGLLGLEFGGGWGGRSNLTLLPTMRLGTPRVRPCAMRSSFHFRFMAIPPSIHPSEDPTVSVPTPSEEP